MKNREELKEQLKAYGLEPLGLSMEEAAAFIGCGRTMAYELVKAGEIKTVKVGARRLVPPDEARAYMRRRIASQDDV